MAKQQQTRKYTRTARAEKDKATHVDGNITFHGCKIRKRHRGQLAVILQFKASIHMHSTAKSVTTGAHRGAWKNTGAVQKKTCSFRRPRGGGEVGRGKRDGKATTNTKIHAICESEKRLGNSLPCECNLQRTQDPERTQRTAGRYSTM